MRKVCIIVLLTSLLFYCNDTPDISADRQSLILKNVGEQIPISVADRWVKRFQQKRSTAARENSTLMIESAQLRNVVRDPENLIGVKFHYGHDASHNQHILIETRGQSTSPWFDSYTASYIHESAASALIENHKSQNPNAPWSHFFGIHVFQEILSKSSLDYVEIVPGINDEDEDQLLLFVWYNVNSSSGRSEGEVEVFDKSNRCPPLCD